MSEERTEEQQPLLRVVRGTPDDVELAALTAAVSCLAAGEGERAPDSARRTRSLWSDPRARLRSPLHPGPGAWRASALPQ
ncbi:acyl-CoA carboxylase subunit epsilon [Haloechinothrix sp. LS1_15]|uniref:acyl-CoA carboxylase subunit epsilon n=1 Tax=Haloechinothrix sp. LS1_15 TaxID=2652248 RepID=UPI002947E92A|nr:acyl-CoA carboxylase subunit epsilon [Haloechinothrix sp. LS1_15]MDV6012949.1 acyl-CoA carboxylase subunit epsilon [Haloechinothrix sp. LS1_15]